MRALLLLALLIQDPRNSKDPGGIDPAKELPIVLAAAKAKADKGWSYKGGYALIETDSVKDQAVTTSGSICGRFVPGDAKKKQASEWAFALQEAAAGDSVEPASKTLAVPKRLLTLRPPTKDGDDIDLSKDKTLRVWPLLGTPFGDLLKDYDAKLIRFATQYELAKTTKSSQGGDTNSDADKNPTKPGFDGGRSHMFFLTPKNSSVAAQCKKITVCVDMEFFFLTRIEFDWKGDGTRKSAINLKDLDVNAKPDDAAFTLDATGYDVKKR